MSSSSGSSSRCGGRGRGSSSIGRGISEHDENDENENEHDENDENENDENDENDEIETENDENENEHENDENVIFCCPSFFFLSHFRTFTFHLMPTCSRTIIRSVIARRVFFSFRTSSSTQ